MDYWRNLPHNYNVATSINKDIDFSEQITSEFIATELTVN